MHSTAYLYRPLRAVSMTFGQFCCQEFLARRFCSRPCPQAICIYWPQVQESLKKGSYTIRRTLSRTSGFLKLGVLPIERACCFGLCANLAKFRDASTTYRPPWPSRKFAFCTSHCRSKRAAPRCGGRRPWATLHTTGSATSCASSRRAARAWLALPPAVCTLPTT